MSKSALKRAEKELRLLTPKELTRLQKMIWEEERGRTKRERFKTVRKGLKLLLGEELSLEDYLEWPRMRGVAIPEDFIPLNAVLGPRGRAIHSGSIVVLSGGPFKSFSGTKPFYLTACKKKAILTSKDLKTFPVRITEEAITCAACQNAWTRRSDFVRRAKS